MNKKIQARKSGGDDLPRTPANGSIVIKQSIEITMTCGDCGVKETIKVNNQGENFSILIDRWNAENSLYGWKAGKRIVCQSCAFKHYQENIQKEAANG